MLHRRLLAGGLAGILVLTLLGLPASVVMASPGGPGWQHHVRDTSGPLQPAEHDAASPTGLAPTTPPASNTPAGPGAPPGDDQRQGSVVAVFADPADPLIVISVETGYVTVRLRCGALCPSIHLGDYVVAEGRRRSEAVFDAVEIWVVSP